MKLVFYRLHAIANRGTNSTAHIHTSYRRKMIATECADVSHSITKQNEDKKKTNIKNNIINSRKRCMLQKTAIIHFIPYAVWNVNVVARNEPATYIYNSTMMSFLLIWF